jgi:hypothetical protein
MIKLRRTWAGHVARMGEKRNEYRILVSKAEGKRLLGRPRRRWVVNIKRDLREIEWGGKAWIHLAQDRDRWRALVNTVMNLRVPQNVGKFSSSCAIGGFSRRAQLHEVSGLLKDDVNIWSTQHRMEGQAIYTELERIHKETNVA